MLSICISWCFFASYFFLLSFLSFFSCLLSTFSVNWVNQSEFGLRFHLDLHTLEGEKIKNTCETVFTAHLSLLYIKTEEKLNDLYISCHSYKKVSLVQVVLMNVDSLEKSSTFFSWAQQFYFHLTQAIKYLVHIRKQAERERNNKVKVHEIRNNITDRVDLCDLQKHFTIFSCSLEWLNARDETRDNKSSKDDQVTVWSRSTHSSTTFAVRKMSETVNDEKVNNDCIMKGKERKKYFGRRIVFREWLMGYFTYSIVLSLRERERKSNSPVFKCSPLYVSWEVEIVEEVCEREE